MSDVIMRMARSLKNKFKEEKLSLEQGNTFAIKG